MTGKSARLKRVVTSSTGAEVYALSAAAREMVAVRNQLRELQHPIEATSTLRGDNQSSLLVATTPGKHRSSLQHLELHAFQVKDFVDNGGPKGAGASQAAKLHIACAAERKYLRRLPPD